MNFKKTFKSLFHNSGAQNDPLVSAFKSISISGRLAYGAKCLEDALQIHNISDPVFNELVLPRIWDFTTSRNLTDWDDNTREVDPVCVLDEKLENIPFDFSTIDFSTFLHLKQVYENIPGGIREMIEDVIDIGGGNLYGGTGEFSQRTLIPLIRVINNCKALGVPLPNIETFKKAKFKERNGWGEYRPREYCLTD